MRNAAVAGRAINTMTLSANQGRLTRSASQMATPPPTVPPPRFPA